MCNRILLCFAATLLTQNFVQAKEPLHPAATIVVFGASTTAPRGPLLNYGALLQRELPALLKREVRIVNAGIPGNTTTAAKARFQRDVLDHKPDLVVILLGTNDSMIDVWKSPPATTSRVPAATTAENLRYFIRTLRQENVAPVLMTLNPMRWTKKLKEFYGKPPYDPADPMGLNVTLVECNKVIREVAREEEAPLVDLYSAFTQHEKDGRSLDELYLDGMHPNDQGHRIIADQLLPVVVEQLARPDSVGK